MTQASELYEKLGAFYLGREYDLQQGKSGTSLLLYDSKDLVTHAVIIGMTGSGKTGLGIDLLEEAVLDGIPALVIDPKGDMGNLLLTFPELRPDQFEPWVSADDARREGKSLQAYAADQAERWRNGLQAWDQDGARIARLRDAAEFTVYTPGSDAGMPVSIVASFAAPSESVLQDSDLLCDRVSSTVTSLLTLVGLDADPIRSREHILLTTLLNRAWQAQESLTLADIIRQVQSPPVRQVGVMDLESFFPTNERFEFAMVLNNLLAAPGFAMWMTGESLDIGQLLYGPAAKPRVAIFSIAHLTDTERMFFLSLLLNEVLAWMRSRPGTTSLRAILYIDEVFGFMPPVAEPPSKRLLLTLLKQARAYGLGVVLATQNPVDLDYKGLSNTGTWFLGRLQTERDKERVLAGLEGAASAAGASFDRKELSNTLSGLGKRIFLMHNVHEDAPVTFETRWTLSYLAGPMTRSQIKQLMKPRKATEQASTDDFSAELPPLDEPVSADALAGTEFEATTQRLPPLSPKIDQYVVSVRRPVAAESLAYEPRLVAMTSVHYVQPRSPIQADEELVFIAPIELAHGGINWDRADILHAEELPLQTGLDPARSMDELPVEATKPGNFTKWRKELANHVYHTRRYPLFHSDLVDATSQPGEGEREFRIRLRERMHEERDKEIANLRKKYAGKIASAERQVRKAEQRLDRERSQAEGARWQGVVSLGATVFSALFGRKALSSGTLGRATTAARGWGRSVRQQEDVQRAFEDIRIYEERLMELHRELEQEIREIAERLDPMTHEFRIVHLKPRRTDINIRLFGLAWVPMRVTPNGERQPAYK